MSTISWNKNPLILADKYSKDFKSYESYMKHCLNILKNINWLKRYQFEQGVSDLQYIEKFFNTFGMGFFDIASVFSDFNKKVLPKLSKENIKLMKTNRFYVDTINEFIMSMSDIFQNQNGYDSLLYGNNPKLLDFATKYQQVHYNVLSNNYEIDEDKFYTDDEIIDLILQEKIMIVEAFAKNTSYSTQEIMSMQSDGGIELIAHDFNGGYLGFGNSGDITGYFEAINKDEKTRWFIRNMLPLHFLRNDQLSFKIGDENNAEFCGYRADKYFMSVVDHISSISNLVERNFKKRRKVIPQNYLDLNKNIGQNSLKEKKDFENDTFINFDFEL